LDGEEFKVKYRSLETSIYKEGSTKKETVLTVLNWEKKGKEEGRGRGGSLWSLQY